MNTTMPQAQPAARGLFYAIALTAVSMLTGCDDLDVHAAAQADLADAIAAAAKEAGQ